MKWLFIFLFLILVQNVCTAQYQNYSGVNFIPDSLENRYAIKNWKLNGKIKSVHITEYELSYELKTNKYKTLEEVPLDERIYSDAQGRYYKFSFDKHGNISSYIDGKIRNLVYGDKTKGLKTDTSTNILYLYDENHNLILIKDNRHEYSEYSGYYKYAYDEKKRRILFNEGTGRGLGTEVKYEYNGNVKTEYTRIRRVDSLFHKDKEYIYNAKGQLIEFKDYSSVNFLYVGNGELFKENYYRYNDGEGMLIVESNYYLMPNKPVKASDTLWYNEKGQLIASIYHSNSGVPKKIIYEYNQNNLLNTETEYSYYTDGSEYYPLIGWNLYSKLEISYGGYDLNKNPTGVYYVWTHYHHSDGELRLQGPELTKVQKIKYEYY
ncbi:MAG: hypothetical protein POELPBGB_03645 [Bacteroidia bacterium]|nr:hypothetical protein [Bacteroidia bacterium]